MGLHDPLLLTLELVADALSPARHDWWIIAGAACRLHGIDDGPVRDVDVLLDERDFDAVLAPLGLVLQKGTSDGLFRSNYLVSWNEPPLVVELFAGFELCEQGEWQKILPETREWQKFGTLALPVQARGELAALLRRFGRPKDLARAALLSPSVRSPSRSGNA